MNYLNIFGLTREPFSTSPDPDFFYHSKNHDTCLKRLEISIRLRRGLCLVLGDVGTGKTTLSRTLIQQFKEERDFIFHMMLDPGAKSEFQFFTNLVKMFGIASSNKSILDLKESLEKYLFRMGAEQGKTIVLIVDEGQKLTTENLEILRTLLNYETNEYKLLQLIIMAQSEFLPRVAKINNFSDRISFKYIIKPLSQIETKEMIEFRLKQAGFKGKVPLFTDEAIKLIHKATFGYPRRVSLVCHNALTKALMYDQPNIDRDAVNSLILEEAGV